VKLLDLLEKAINKQIAYNDAVQELKKLNLPLEDQEKYEILFYKLLGNESKILHEPQYFFPSIPNESYIEIFQFTIALVRDGLYTPEIAQHLFQQYALSAPLITYFINEAVSAVRMNTMTPEEIASIGEAYHIVASNMERRGLKEKPVIKLKEELETNAEEISQMDIEEDDEED
jgi:hypothetical protein